MGVPGLWDILSPCKQPTNLARHAYEALSSNSNGFRGLRAGIDASIWFVQAGTNMDGSNPEFRNLFLRCNVLLHLGILPVFVFDGPKRPKIKRNKRVVGHSHPFERWIEQCAEAFGFETRKAPGEAEAELAEMNRRGEIDVVFTSDGDTLLFGAASVVKDWSKAISTKDAAQPFSPDFYHASTIFRTLNLTDVRIAFLATLSGGDYDTSGVVGVGPKLSKPLATEFGFAERLEAISQRGSDIGELARLREDVKAELATNKSGKLGRRNAVVAAKFRDDWPAMAVWDYYRHPVTSYNTPGWEAAPPKWQKEPELKHIVRLMIEYLTDWPRIRILGFLRSRVWKGLVLRRIRRLLLDGEEIPFERKNKEKRAKKRDGYQLEDPRLQADLDLFLDTVSACRGAMGKSGNAFDFLGIDLERTKPITGDLLEYRTGIDVSEYARVAGRYLNKHYPPERAEHDFERPIPDNEDGEPASPSKKRNVIFEDPFVPIDEYLPRIILAEVCPELVDAKEEEEEEKRHAKEDKEREKELKRREREEKKANSVGGTKGTGARRKKTANLVVPTTSDGEGEHRVERPRAKRKQKSSDLVIPTASDAEGEQYREKRHPIKQKRHRTPTLDPLQEEEDVQQQLQHGGAGPSRERLGNLNPLANRYGDLGPSNSNPFANASSSHLTPVRPIDLTSSPQQDQAGFPSPSQKENAAKKTSKKRSHAIDPLSDLNDPSNFHAPFTASSSQLHLAGPIDLTSSPPKKQVNDFFTSSKPNAAPRRPKKTTKKLDYVEISSDIEPAEEEIRKSPKRSKAHTSPRSRPGKHKEESEDEELPDFGGKPTRPPEKVYRTKNVVVSLDSD
ncbi:hypothetical protein BT69DRAFT_402864 [Atractiella rhizophila]|nr:hypothetical protein BT69DRAFT_402864 [Atractiella rhizophila]